MEEILKKLDESFVLLQSLNILPTAENVTILHQAYSGLTFVYEKLAKGDINERSQTNAE